jgi:uncharacterized oxidoreductase
MNISQNTILITGGSAGIGFAIAKLFSEQGNHVIITGRNKERLEQAASKLQHVTAIQSDVSKAEELTALVEQLQKDFPALNMVVNNAGQAYVQDLATDTLTADKAADEMLTNYVSIIRLNEKLLPLLRKQQAAAIVNVSSIAAFVPGSRIPTYSASKAALHSYTQSLRFSLEETSIKVFELMPPLVNTDFSQDIGGANGIPPSVVADDLLEAISTDHYEIHVGGTADLYSLSLSAPKAAFEAMNAR